MRFLEECGGGEFTPKRSLDLSIELHALMLNEKQEEHSSDVFFTKRNAVMLVNGGFLKKWWYPLIIIQLLDLDFHYQPTILGYPHL